MEDCRALLKLLLIITCVYLPSSDTHTLRYLYTANGHFIAVGLVDGEQCLSFDSNITKKTPQSYWMKEIEDAYPGYWNSETQLMKKQQEKIRAIVNRAKKRFNHTEGDHTVQRMYGCERDDDNTTRGYDQYGYDGEDFISLNLTTGTWTAANDKAQSFINDWDPKGSEAKHWKDFLEKDCIDRLKKFVSYSRKSLDRKVRPEVSVFQKHTPFPEMVCHATGFFPKAVMIIWKKDGEDMNEDVELRETLPNQDGSFQKRSILKVPAEELQKHTYTCVVQQKGSEDIVRGIPTGGAPIAIIIGVVAALLVLAAVVAGIVIWRKKNSGFKPVPPKPSSEGDSSSNNS